MFNLSDFATGTMYFEKGVIFLDGYYIDLFQNTRKKYIEREGVILFEVGN